MIEQFVGAQKSPNTQDAYRRNLAQLQEFLGSDRLSALEPRDLLAFVAWLTEEGYSPSSVNQKLASVKSFLKYASLAGEVRPEVYAASLVVPRVAEDHHLPRILSSEEMERLLWVCSPDTLVGRRLAAFISFALASGARLSEAVGINIEVIDWQRRRLVVRGKGSKDRVVRFSQAAHVALGEYLALRGSPTCGPLFTNDEEERVSPRYLQAELRRTGEKVGINGLHPHTLRHTFATGFLEATGDLHALAQFLGHSDVRTTQLYTRLATRRLDRQYEEFEAAQQTEFLELPVAKQLSRAAA